MKWVKSKGTINLSNVSSTGLATLGVGQYTGMFVGTSTDSGGNQWVTVTTSKGSHIECSDIDVSSLKPGDRISFKISPRDGAIAELKGNKYKLYDQDGIELSGWLDISELVVYIKQQGLVLAEPKLETIDKLETETDKDA